MTLHSVTRRPRADSQSRIKTYSSQPSESLNADQKATLITLPALEAVAKELDELIKPGGPVEVSPLHLSRYSSALKVTVQADSHTAELAQSSILREARDSAEARIETVSVQRVSDFQVITRSHF